MSNISRINVKETVDNMVTKATDAKTHIINKEKVHVRLLQEINRLVASGEVPFVIVALCISLISYLGRTYVGQVQIDPEVLPFWLRVKVLAPTIRSVPSYKIVMSSLVGDVVKVTKMFMPDKFSIKETFLESRKNYMSMFSRQQPIHAIVDTARAESMVSGIDHYLNLITGHAMWAGDVSSVVGRLQLYNEHHNRHDYNVLFNNKTKSCTVGMIARLMYYVYYPRVFGVEIDNHVKLLPQTVEVQTYKGRVKVEIEGTDYGYNPRSIVVPYGKTFRKLYGMEGFDLTTIFSKPNFEDYTGKGYILFTISTKGELQEERKFYKKETYQHYEEKYTDGEDVHLPEFDARPLPRVIFNAQWDVKYPLIILTQAMDHVRRQIATRYPEHVTFVQPIALGTSWVRDGALKFFRTLDYGTGTMYHCPDVVKLDASINNSFIYWYLIMQLQSMKQGPLYERVMRIASALKNGGMATLDGATMSFLIENGLFSGIPGTSYFGTFVTDMVMLNLSSKFISKLRSLGNDELKALFVEVFPPSDEVKNAYFSIVTFDEGTVLSNSVVVEAMMEKLRAIVTMFNTHLFRWRDYGDDLILSRSVLHILLTDKMGLKWTEFVNDTYKSMGFKLKEGTFEKEVPLEEAKFLGCKFGVLRDEYGSLMFVWPKFDTDKIVASAALPTINHLVKPPKASKCLNDKGKTDAAKLTAATRLYTYSVNAWVRARLIGLAVLAYTDPDVMDFLHKSFDNVPVDFEFLRSMHKNYAELISGAIRDVLPTDADEAILQYVISRPTLMEFPDIMELWSLFTSAPLPEGHYKGYEGAKVPWGDRMDPGNMEEVLEVATNNLVEDIHESDLFA